MPRLTTSDSARQEERLLELLERHRSLLSHAEEELTVLAERRHELEHQLRTATEAVQELEARLGERLKLWCALDECETLRRENRDLVEELTALHGAWTFRLFRAVTWPVRRLRQIFA